MRAPFMLLYGLPHYSIKLLLMNPYRYSKLELPNKLRVLFLPLENSESVFVSLVGKAGRRVEAENEIGSAHFLEHLFFDGTKNRPNAFEINKYLEYHGGQTNGFTGQETVEYYVKVLPHKAEIGFDFLSDIFFNSLLEAIEKERKVIYQEMAFRKDNPKDLLLRLRLKTLYPNQSMGRTIFDEEKNSMNIDRNVLGSYLKRNYVAENFILAVAGKIKELDVRRLTQKYFANFRNGKENVFEESKINDNQSFDITNRDFSQSKLSISFRGYPLNSPESSAMALMNYILGIGFSSRLNNRLRNDLHLVYSIGSYNAQFSDTGFVYIETSVSEENLVKTVEEIFKEIRLTIEGSVSDEELQKAKNMYLSDTLFNLEEIDNYTRFLSYQLLLKNEIKDIETKIREINSVQKSDIKNVAEYIFSDKPKINILTKKLKELNNF